MTTKTSPGQTSIETSRTATTQPGLRAQLGAREVGVRRADELLRVRPEDLPDAFRADRRRARVVDAVLRVPRGGVSAVSVMRAPLIYHPASRLSTRPVIARRERLDRLELLERLAAARRSSGSSGTAWGRRGSRASCRSSRSTGSGSRAGAGRARASRPRAARAARKPAARSFSRPSGVMSSVDHESSRHDADLGLAPSSRDLRLHRALHRLERGAAQERRREVDAHGSVVDLDVLDHAEVDERDHGDLRVGDLGERRPDLVGGHHCAPAGAERRTDRHLLPELGELGLVDAARDRLDVGQRRARALLARARAPGGARRRARRARRARARRPPRRAAPPSSVASRRSTHISACMRW